MDHSDFTPKFVIDWLEFEIELNQSTTFRQLRKLTDNYAHALGVEADGDESLHFRFRLHDPKNWFVVQSRLDVIDQQFGLIATPRITALELALDFYAKKHAHVTPDDYATLLYSLSRFGSAIPTASRRYWEQKGAAVAYERRKDKEMQRSECKARFLDFQTFYAGRHPKMNRQSNATCDSVSFRLYFKTTDAGKPLQEKEHRARMETTLCSKALPFATIEDARGFRFAKLTRYFKFREWDKDQIVADYHAYAGCHVERDALKSSVLKINDRAQIGNLEQPEKRKNGGGVRKHFPYTKANTKLNSLTYDALRRFDKQLASNAATSR